MTIVASVAASGFVFGVLVTSHETAQVVVAATALPADDFTAGGTTSTFACTTAASAAAYLVLTNTGTAGASVATVSIDWAGVNTAYAPVGSCDIGASGSPTATIYIVFPATSKLVIDAVASQAYAGTVILSNGARLPLVGSWQ